MSLFSILGPDATRVARIVTVVLCAVLAGGNVLAQSTSPTENNALVSERPAADSRPTPVTVAVYFFDIDEINDVRQQFSVDMFFRVTWQDPRLALPADQRAGQLRVIPRDHVWRPKGLIINDRGLHLQLPQVVEVDDMGNVRYRQRVTGNLSFESELSRFPFDVQYLPVDFVSYADAPDELLWSRESVVIGSVTTLATEGWSFTLLKPEFGELTIPEEGISRPRMTFLIEAQRESQYYLLTMFLPMSLIIFMAWTVFWLQPDIVSSRIAISTASIFSLIAFGFSLRLSLPRVSYLTIADVFVIGCTLMVFLALGVAVIGSRMVLRSRFTGLVSFTVFCTSQGRTVA